jgi:uncharacterized protein (TIGR02466 family)
MQKLDLFPTTFFIFDNTELDNKKLIADLSKYTDRMKSGNILSSLHTLHDKQEFTNLFSWFDQCLEEIRVDQHYDCEQFKITNSWFNIAKSQSSMHIHHHRHSMSFFSGVYYLTEGAPTEFEDPVLHRTQAQLEVLRFHYSPYERIIPQPGRLVIFPSWMYHCSIPHVDNHDRYIISFNTLPNGAVNYNIASDSVVDITINLREKLK